MNWLRRMMVGRYGPDQLSFALLALSVVLILLSFFTRVGLFSSLALVVLILCYYRMFSRKFNTRYQENARFMRLWQPVSVWFLAPKRWLARTAVRFRDRKTHCYFKCPDCGQQMRVPKGKGKINITCPKCKASFVKKT